MEASGIIDADGESSPGAIIIRPSLARIGSLINPPIDATY